MLIAVKKPDHAVFGEDILVWFDGKVASWWKPDAVIFVDQLPHTATGKISKLSLREQYGDYLIPQNVRNRFILSETIIKVQ